MIKIGIVGPNKAMCSEKLYDFGVQLGEKLATRDNLIVCGGLGGFMEAVCKGVKQSRNSFNGQTIGILPGERANEANPFIDLAIPTGMGIARNTIIVNTADIIIAAGGGAGTLSELAFAWQLNKKVLCVTLFDGWAKQLAGQVLDDRKSDLLISVNSIEEILEQLEHG
jgi:uncharacterized protein (TIGR00725 family)